MPEATITANATGGKGLAHSAKALACRFSIGHYLAFLVLAAFLPAVGLALVLFYGSIQREYEVTWQRAEARTTFTIAAVDSQMDALSGTLDALAADPSLAQGDLATFEVTARSLTGERVDAVSIVRPDGVTIFNSRVPAGMAVPAFSVPPEAVQRALKDRRTVITDIFPGGFSRRPIFGMLKSVTIDSKPMVLAAGLFADRFAPLVNRTLAPWQSGIIDSHGGNVVGFPAVPSKVFPDGAIQQAATEASPRRRLRLRSAGGEDLLVVVERSPQSGWASVSSLPASEAEGPAKHQATFFVTGALILVVPSVLLAALLGYRLAHAMGALSAFAGTMGRGQMARLPEGTASVCREVGNVAVHLEAAAAEITARDTQLRLQRDLAERKSEELRVQSQKLEHLIADLEQFAYVASHDLREPLRMINSFLSLLERHLQPVLDADSREYLGFACTGARRLDRMILDLLDYSRIGRLDAQDRAVDLAKAVAEAIARLALTVAETKAEVTVTSPLPTVTAAPQEMERLFQNLIGNALKYHAPERPPRVTVSAQPLDDGVWQVSVADNGIGIEAEYHQRIFQIFQRLHTRERYEGTGIGLAICKKIVERRGGRIWLDSVPGQGTTFHFTVAAAQPTPGET